MEKIAIECEYLDTALLRVEKELRARLPEYMRNKIIIIEVIDVV